jgi:hypothetical protein
MERGDSAINARSVEVRDVENRWQESETPALQPAEAMESGDDVVDGLSRGA